MAANESHYCMCMRHAPGAVEIKGNDKAAVLRDAKWDPGTVITATFLGGSDALQQRVRDVAEEWIGQDMANLFFRWVDDDRATIRIAFEQGKGSWSYLGTVNRSIRSPEPTMNFGWLTDESDDAAVRKVVLHEFGHAIGLIHEHQNPQAGVDWNRQAVIDDLSGPPNNWDEAKIEHNMFRKYDPDAVEATETDATSIMMYPIPQRWTRDGFSAGLNAELSDLDRQLIRQAYPWM